MRILIASDAWHPQINGVVRTLDAVVDELRALGDEVEVLGPDRFATVPMPSYPEVRIAVAPGRNLTRLMDQFRPDAVHIPVEGPIGLAARRHCLRRRWPFTTSYHTRAGIYFEEKFGVPNDLVLALQRWFHNAGNGFMVQTDSLEQELRNKGFVNIRRWSRGVDTELFRPVSAQGLLDLPRPVFTYVGRVSSEKNLDDFLVLDLPGSKVVVGDGPQLATYRERYPDVLFAGWKKGEELSRYYSASDVFVLEQVRDFWPRAAGGSGLWAARCRLSGARPVGRDWQGASWRARPGPAPCRPAGAVHTARAVPRVRHAVLLAPQCRAVCR